MQHPLDMGGGHHFYPGGLDAMHPDHRSQSHRYRSFMIEEILTEHHPEHHKASGGGSGSPAGDLLKFGVQALLAARPFHSHLLLKADHQTGLLKFPMSPLSCSLGSPLGSPLLSGPPGLGVGPASHHLPLDLHLRGKLEQHHGSEAGGGKSKKGRRSRTVFTELQLMGLEKRFEKQKYLSTPDRIDLAESLGLSQLQVKTWYQNRRMKWKKIVLQGGGLESPTKPKGRPKKNSIPTSEQLLSSEQETRSQSVSEGSTSSHLDNTSQEE